MSLSEHAVLRRIADRTSISRPADFVLEPGRPVERARVFEPEVSPYCFDLEAGQVYCVATPDIEGAAFFYQAQRQSARSVIKVPFGALPDAATSPTLIFSIGRCGSTLLYRAFEAAGVRAVSEPDYFTQAALAGQQVPGLQDAIGRATKLLPYAAIKLRAECSNAPLLVAGAFREPQLVFVLRNAADWAESVRRVSARPNAAATAALLRGFVDGLGLLARHYAVRICYYDDFRVPTATYFNGLLAALGHVARLRPARAAELARADAQEGSVVSRAATKSAPDDLLFADEFRRAWDRLRPAALIERLELKGL